MFSRLIVQTYFLRRLHDEKVKLGDPASSGIKLRLNLGPEQPPPTAPKIKLNINSRQASTANQTPSRANGVAHSSPSVAASTATPLPQAAPTPSAPQPAPRPPPRWPPMRRRATTAANREARRRMPPPWRCSLPPEQPQHRRGRGWTRSNRALPPLARLRCGRGRKRPTTMATTRQRPRNNSSSSSSDSTRHPSRLPASRPCHQRPRRRLQDPRPRPMHSSKRRMPTTTTKNRYSDQRERVCIYVYIYQSRSHSRIGGLLV